jgi:hypothetical protein
MRDSRCSRTATYLLVPLVVLIWCLRAVAEVGVRVMPVGLTSLVDSMSHQVVKSS